MLGRRKSRIFRSDADRKKDIIKRLKGEDGYSSRTKKDATFIDNNVDDIQHFIRTHYISNEDLR
jgi:hypothetical protein